MNEPPLIPDNILRFLNALPTTGDTVAWILQFRAALQELLGDVDRIAVNINIACNPIGAYGRKKKLYITQHAKLRVQQDMSMPIVLSHHETYSSKDLIAEFRRLGYPLDDYQSPACFDYYLSNGLFLATIGLFRKRGRPPITEQTLQTVVALRPFLLVVFSGGAMRHYADRPVDLLFVRTIGKVWDNADLTVREMQVLSLHLFGLSYAQIARQLFISENTVAKHVKAAHRKTGCESFLELFRPYFRESLAEPGI